MSASTDMKTNMSRRRKKKKGIVETWITIGIFVAIFFATTVGFYFECDASKKFDEGDRFISESISLKIF